MSQSIVIFGASGDLTDACNVLVPGRFHIVIRRHGSEKPVIRVLLNLPHSEIWFSGPRLSMTGI